MYFDLIKRIPHNPADKPDFRSPDFDLTLSVVGSQAHALLIEASTPSICRSAPFAAQFVCSQGFESVFQSSVIKAIANSDVEIIVSTSRKML